MALTYPTMTEGQWNLVATNITSGQIEQLKSNYKIWRTFVNTGLAAPLDAIKDKSPRIFIESNQEPVTFKVAKDIYFWIENNDEDSDDTNVADIVEVSS